MDIKIIAAGSTYWQKLRKYWGLAFLIQQNILFDTFANPQILFSNLRKQKIDIKKIKHIVISHDHWDHTGGLWKILKQEKGMNVYSCPGFSSKFKTNVKTLSGNLIENNDVVEINKNIYLTGQIKGVYENKEISEQALLVDTGKGLSIITGCAHPGIIKIIEFVKAKFSQKQIYAVLGGFHLMQNNSDEIKKIADNFKRLGIKKAGPAHCSGRQAEIIFKKIYKENFIKTKAGVQIKV